MTAAIALSTPAEIEADLLGAFLTSEPAFDAAVERLSPEKFSQHRLAVIFRAMLAQKDAGEPVADELAIVRRLEQSDDLAAVGGQQYVSMLAGKASAAGRMHPEIRAEQILEAWRLRKAQALADRLRRVTEINGDCTAISEELRELLSETANAAVSGAQAVALSTIERQSINWLWPERIPLGMLSLLMGDPGLGKSLLTIDLAAKVTRAGGTVLLLSAEDHAGATIRPRAEAAGANLDLLHVVTMRREGMEEGLALPDDAPELDRLIEKHEAKLVIVDPLMAHLRSSVNSWNDQSMRSVMAPLHRAAEAHGCAVLVVVHLNKATGASPLYRAGGSIGIPAAVRSALLLARDPEDEDSERGSQRVLAHVKCNIAPQAESLSARIETVAVEGSDTARFLVTGTSGVSAIDLLAAPIGEQRTKRDDAADFLREELGDGAKPTKDLQAAARAAGIGWRTVEDAKADLGVKASKLGFGGGWTWSLPEDRTSEDRTPHISEPAVFAETASQSGIEDRKDTEDRKTAEIGNGSAELGGTS